MTQNPSFDLEQKFGKVYGTPVAGVDEAGRGPWAGPVVAAAVILDPKKVPDGLNDSKKLTAKKRDVLYEQIIESATVGVSLADVKCIDEMNILHASLWAMAQAVSKLPLSPNIVLVDGNKAPDMSIAVETVVKGDSRSLSIAAASIIAKVTRDRMMCELAQKYPGYGWQNNKGYGTKEHIQGLHEHGVTQHHRRSFKPIRAFDS